MALRIIINEDHVGQIGRFETALTRSIDSFGGEA
jgi:hypothetical protein